jgi:hypothetical protein
MALSVVVRCGDHEEDEEDKEQIERRAEIHTQELLISKASARAPTSPNLQ